MNRHETVQYHTVSDSIPNKMTSRLPHAAEQLPPTDTKRSSSLMAAQNLLNQQAATGPHPERELRAVTAGQVADLLLFQQQSSAATAAAADPYDPIEPFVLKNLQGDAQSPPPVEAGRLQTRLYSLKEKLRGERN